MHGLKIISLTLIFLTLHAHHGSIAADNGMIRRNRPNFGCPEGIGVACLNCTELVFCINGEVVETMSCSGFGSRHNYCDPKTRFCTTQNTCSEPEKPNIQCFYEDFHPHPIYSDSFIYCKGNNWEGEEYSCPAGSFYDSSRKICTREKVPSIDFTEEGLCAGNEGKIVVHPVDKSYYTRCSPFGGQIQMHTCRSPFGIMDPEMEECTFVCQREGFFSDPNDETMYFVCIAEENVLVEYHQKCPDNQIFPSWGKFCL